MGSIKLEYICSKRTDVKTIINEIEYGNTFIINHEGEKTVPLWGNDFFWVKPHIIDDCRFYLYVDDSFFTIETFFEKIITAFIYNLQDFGAVRLELIDISNSELDFLYPEGIGVDIFSNYPICGTIFKPYYHFSRQKKCDFASKMISMGIDLIKEDETYLICKEQLIYDAIKIQSTMGPNAFYVPNITSFVHDYNLLSMLYDAGIKIVMVNFLVTGFSQINRLKQSFPKLKIWGHRVGYSPLENIISMKALAKIAVLSGIDYLHLGTSIERKILAQQHELINELRMLAPFLPVFSKTSPEINPMLLNNLGHELILMACGYFRNEQTSEINWAQVKKWIRAAKLDVKLYNN